MAMYLDAIPFCSTNNDRLSRFLIAVQGESVTDSIQTEVICTLIWTPALLDDFCRLRSDNFQYSDGGWDGCG